MSEFLVEDLENGQRVVAVKSIDGTTMGNSELLAEVVVDTGDGTLQRCVAVKGFGGGSGDGLPSQEGQSGKFLTTNGTNASWGNIPSSNVKLEDIAIAGDGIKFVYGSTENFTTTGSVEINDGIATNLDGGSINTGIAFMPGNNPWEIHMKVETGTLTGSAKWFSQSSPNYYASPLFGTEVNKMYALISGNGSSWSILNSKTGSTSLSNNAWYYIRLKFTGTQYIYSYSLDDSTWNDEIAVTSSTPIFQQDTNKLLFTGGGSLNSIDLNETYIKVNDVIVWQAFGDISTIPFIKSDIGFGASAPTTSTEGYIGKLYITSGGDAYICTGISGSTYTWKKMTE